MYLISTIIEHNSSALTIMLQRHKKVDYFESLGIKFRYVLNILIEFIYFISLDDRSIVLVLTSKDLPSFPHPNGELLASRTTGPLSRIFPFSLTR